MFNIESTSSNLFTLGEKFVENSQATTFFAGGSPPCAMTPGASNVKYEANTVQEDVHFPNLCVYTNSDSDVKNLYICMNCFKNIINIYIYIY